MAFLIFEQLLLSSLLLSSLHIESTIVSGQSPVVVFTRSARRPTDRRLSPPLPLAVLPRSIASFLSSPPPPMILPPAASRTIGVEEEQSNCLLCASEH